MKICVAGKNDIACNVLALCVDTVGRENVLALANRDDNGQHKWQRSLRKVADALKVNTVELSDLYIIEDLVFLSVEFDRIINPGKFKTKALYNIHFSLLPKYKGVYTAVWPLLNGEEKTGVTLHLIEKGIDTGPIIDQVAFSVEMQDNARSVYFRCMKLGYDVIAKNLPKLINGGVAMYAQSSIGSTYYSVSSINFSQVCIDLNRTAYQISNQIRAFCFREYQLPMVHGYKILSSVITNEVSLVKPGTILVDSDSKLKISTIDVNLLLIKDFYDDFFEAVQKGDVKECVHSVKLISDINVTNKMGWSALMIAAYNNNYGIVAELMKFGADVNQVNKNGTSVIMYAKNGFINHGDIRVLDLLIKGKANVSLVDCTGKSVLNYCVEEGNDFLINYFNKYV